MTCLKFYGSKDDVKLDANRMLAATCTLKNRLEQKVLFLIDRRLDTAGYVKIWHYPSEKCVFTLDENERQPLTLDFNCNYNHLFVAGEFPLLFFSSSFSSSSIQIFRKRLCDQLLRFWNEQINSKTSGVVRFSFSFRFLFFDFELNF